MTPETSEAVVTEKKTRVVKKATAATKKHKLAKVKAKSKGEGGGGELAVPEEVKAPEIVRSDYPVLEGLFKGRESSIIEVDPDSIIADPKVSGRSFTRNQKKYEEIKRSITQQGQLEACAVSVGSDGRLDLITGFGRHKIAQELGRKLKVFLLNAKDAGEAFIKGVHGNIKRNPLTVVDMANAIRHLFDIGQTYDEIAENLGIAKSYVYMHKRIWNLPSEVQQAAHEGKISANTAFDLGMLKTEEALEKYRELVDAAGGSGKQIKSSATRKMLKNRKVSVSRVAGVKTDKKTGRKTATVVRKQKEVSRSITIAELKAIAVTHGSNTKETRRKVVMVCDALVEVISGKIGERVFLKRVAEAK